MTHPQAPGALAPTGKRIAKVVALASAVALLGACSVLQEDKIDYKSAKPVQVLEVPPDLTQLSGQNRFSVAGGVATASSFQVSAPGANTAAATATSQVGDVRIVRMGSQRWLVVDRPADALWAPVQNFWKESGFALVLEERALGLLETEWAENRAKLPQDIIRSTIGRVFENLYSTGERDKFRTRLERNDAGGTEIFISHRGMIEVYSNERKDSTVWQPRPADPELEAEMLRRLMVKLGVSEQQSKALVAAGAAEPAARLVSADGKSVVQLAEGFDRAWRRVGLSLDRTGFTVEDRDRSQGIYFVRYVAPNEATSTKEPGFFGRLFSSKPADAAPARYRISVKSEGNLTRIAVLNADGQPEANASAERILRVLADDLK
jgi:outer membrane protein assembly factor BamC